MSSPDLSLTLFVGASLGLALTAIAPQPAAARACDVDQCTVNTAELRGVDIKGLNGQRARRPQPRRRQRHADRA